MLPDDILDIGIVSWLVLPLVGFIVGALIWKKFTWLTGWLIVVTFSASRTILEASTDTTPELDRLAGGIILFSIYYWMMVISYKFLDFKFKDDTPS